MGKIYVNDGEYNFLVRLIEDAMLTEGELDSEWYECAESLLIKLGYPESYRKDITDRLSKKEFRFKRPRCCQEKDIKDAILKENNRVLNLLSELIGGDTLKDDCWKKITRVEKAIKILRLSEAENENNS